MIDHLSYTYANFPAAKRFFQAALQPLGIGIAAQFGEAGKDEVIGLGDNGQPQFWISQGPQLGHVHLALKAPTRAAVDAFHAAALGAGGKDNGAPGLRPNYHPNYYAAFVIDPDGHNIEAVCHAAE